MTFSQRLIAALLGVVLGVSGLSALLDWQVFGPFDKPVLTLVALIALFYVLINYRARGR